MRYIMAIVHLRDPEIFETAAQLLDFDGMETEHITEDCVHGFVLDTNVYNETVKRYGINWDGDYPAEHIAFLKRAVEDREDYIRARFLWFVVDA